MKTLFSALLLASTLISASAQNFLAILDGLQDGGGARMGMGMVNLSLSGTTLTLSGSYSGLTTAATDGHIHGAAPAGVNAGVRYNLVALGNMTVGSTAGTFSGSVNLVPLSSGTYTVAQQIADLNNGLWYINIHNSTFPGGEIRGQILPVPEPGTWALGGLGLLALLAWKRRK